MVIAAGKRPASIPNLEAKPASADGTAPGRVWESRTPPQQPSKGGARNTNSSRPHHFSIPTRQAARGASLETRKTISGRPPFLAYAPFIATSTCQHMLPCERTPRIRTQRRDYRKRARLACNCAASTQAPLTRPMRPPAHSASVLLLDSSRCSSNWSFE